MDTSDIPQHQPAPLPERLAYTVPETARLLGISRAGVYNLIHAGTVVSVKLGGRRLVRRADLEALLADLAAAPAPAATAPTGLDELA